MKLSDDFLRNFMREVILPLTAVLLFTFCAASFTVFWTTTQINREAQTQQQQIVEASLSQNLDEMLIQQRSLARWHPLMLQLQQNPLDERWLDENVGGWMFDMFDHQAIFLLDAQQRPVYVFINGQRAEIAAWAPFQQALQPWLDAMKQQQNGNRRRQDIADYTRIGDRAAALVIGDISSDAAQRGTFKIVSLRFLDEAFFDALHQRNMLNDLHLTTGSPEQHGAANYQLTAQQGRTIGYIVWQPSRPGARLLQVVGPMALIVVIIITLICFAMIRRLWASSLNLSQSLLQLGASEAQAQHLAFHDVLTGLPNRALIQDRLTQALARAARQEDRVALLLLDLDRFKLINDTFGHHAGDDLIIEVAQRLNTLLRESDTVGRIGGDEFVIVMSDVTEVGQVNALCQRIIDAISQPFTLLGSETWIGVSIGMVLAPIDGLDRLELMRKADIALYEAKNEGRGRYRQFIRSMDESVQTRQQIATELRSALQQKRDIEVWYQPLVDINGQDVVGFEALLRWKHPTRGFISPTEFIPIAEETGLIIPIGEWVLREACRSAQKWPELTLSINISPLQFRAAGFVQRFADIVAEENADASHIELEITEGVLIEDEKEAHKIILSLREAGFRIALDDFGTGYSSLNYLSHFPVDKIKIDRSFIQSLGVAENATAIIESVVKLGHAMGLTVTAEGVENRVQMDALAEAGCNHLQGYLFSRAIPREQIDQMLEERKVN